MDRRAFLRLVGMAVAGGIGSVVATSVRLSDQANLQTQFRQVAPAANLGTTASHRKAKRSAEVIPDLFRLPGIRGVNAYLWMPRPNQSAPGEAFCSIAVGRGRVAT